MTAIHSIARLTAALAAVILTVSGVRVGGPSADLQNAEIEAARSYLHDRARSLGLTDADIRAAVATDVVRDAHTGVTHVYLVQTHGGIAVRGAELNVTLSPSGEVVSAAGRFVPNLASAVKREAPVLDAIEATRAAARSLGLMPSSALTVKDSTPGPARETVLTAGGIADGKIPVKLVYQRIDTHRVRLGWLVEIERPDGSHWWVVVVDAETGAILETSDRVVSG